MAEVFDFVDDYALKRGDTARFPFIFNEGQDDGSQVPIDLAGRRFDMHIKMRNSQSQEPLATFSTTDNTIQLSSNVITIPNDSLLPVANDGNSYWAEDTEILWVWVSPGGWTSKGTMASKPTNYLQIIVSHVVSRNLPPRDLYYDLQEINGQEVFTYIEGTFQVIEETTDRGPL